jgi:hypothetical protein
VLPEMNKTASFLYMFNITSNYPLAFALIFLAFAFTISFLSYRKSQIVKSKKYILIALRTLAVFLVLTLLLEPSILRFLKGGSDGINIFLIDGSRSNSLEAGGKTKEAAVKEALNKFSFGSDDRIYFYNAPELKYINKISDSLSFSGFETNLSDAVKNIREASVDAPVKSFNIISDGIITSGGNPVYEAKQLMCPVNIIVSGDTVQHKDITAYNVIFNERAFTGTSTLIKAEIRSYASSGASINVHLLREGTEISSKTISVKSDNDISEASFDITESTPGYVKYRIIAEPLSGEYTLKNNYRDFIIQYLENKTNVLFISSGPGYDNALFQDILKRVKTINTTFRTAKSANEFYEGSIDYRAFGELSAVFLLGFPASGFSAEITKEVASRCREYNIPVIFFAQKNTDYKLQQIFDELIPFTVSRSSGETTTGISLITNTESGLNKIVSLGSMQVFKNTGGIIQKAGSTALMTDKSGGEPLFLTRNNGDSKSTAFLGYGLWRWRLNPASNNEETAEKFIIESVNLSLIKDKKSRLKVYPVKTFFDYKEPVEIIAEVYDDLYKPTTNAVVTGKITSADRKFSQKIEFQISGSKFSAKLPPFPVNDYTIEAEAEINKSIYAKDNNRMIIDTSNAEYLKTKSDYVLLNEAALNTGGNIMLIANADRNLLKLKENPSPSVSSAYKNNLWENKYILFLIIALFTVEWIIKKRNNIP